MDHDGSDRRPTPDLDVPGPSTAALKAKLRSTAGQQKDVVETSEEESSPTEKVAEEEEALETMPPPPEASQEEIPDGNNNAEALSDNRDTENDKEDEEDDEEEAVELKNQEQSAGKEEGDANAAAAAEEEPKKVKKGGVLRKITNKTEGLMKGTIESIRTAREARQSRRAKDRPAADSATIAVPAEDAMPGEGNHPCSEEEGKTDVEERLEEEPEIKADEDSNSGAVEDTTTDSDAANHLEEIMAIVREQYDYIQIDIEKSHLLKDHQRLGMGKMDPFVLMKMGNVKITRTPTAWDAHMQPLWNHPCPRIALEECDDQTLCFQVFNDSRLGALNQRVIASTSIPMSNLVQRTYDNIQKQMMGSMTLGLAAKIVLELDNGEGTLILSVKFKEWYVGSSQNNAESGGVEPSWFESPAQPMEGTEQPFFRLKLTELGMEQTTKNTPNYFVGKDVIQAAGEKDFYEDTRRIVKHQLEQKGAGLMAPFVLDYLGVLTTKTTPDTPEPRQLLVLQNLGCDYQKFRRLNLKMGQLEATQGRSNRFRPKKFLDAMTNSNQEEEGYMLEGFVGMECMDSLVDVLPKESGSNAKRIISQSLKRDDIFRYFLDLHLDTEPQAKEKFSHYLPVEVAELVLHDLVAQLVNLAARCHCMEVPQKWIGSTVVLGYDSQLFPPRKYEEAEATIRSKVIVNVLDWGQSELLTQQQFVDMTDAEQEDRQKCWESYKNGINRLAHNATREYYHRFTNTNAKGWTQLTLEVMDFDSVKSDVGVGKVEIALPDPTDKNVLNMTHVLSLQTSQPYKLTDKNGRPQGKIVCAIKFLAFPSDSRQKGMWRVTVEKALDLPGKSLDPYVAVVAQDACNHRELKQMTSVKCKTLNPSWEEIIDIPVVKSDHLHVALTAKSGISDDSFPAEDSERAKIFQFCGEPSEGGLANWTECLQSAAASAAKT